MNEIYFSEFTESAIGDREGRQRKPAPDPVYAALEEMGCSRERAVYIGDSEVDYQTAVNSGLACILVRWEFGDRKLLESFDKAVVVDECQEIENILL